MIAVDVNKVRNLRDVGLAVIGRLESERGILASSAGENYGCVFGRDSCLTALLLLASHERFPVEAHVELVRKIVFNLGALQGREHNPQSGEEPGKILHEYRPDRHEHLTQGHNWFLYDDGSMKSYDSIDSTPLFLMTAHELARFVPDREEYLAAIEKHVEPALEWLMAHITAHPAHLLAYGIPEGRTHGGLHVQSWMDSTESLFHEDGAPTPFPVAALEVQAYAYAALKRWAHHKRARGQEAAALTLEAHALSVKEGVYKYLYLSREPFLLASGLDGALAPIRSVRSSLGHVLWAAWRAPDADAPSAILDAEDISRLAARLMEPDLFDPMAGIRTLSTYSCGFDAVSYHNGSVWPHDTALAGEGLLRFGFAQEARAVERALFQLWSVFHTPIEFVVLEDGMVCRGRDKPGGQKACLEQAWSAAAMVSQMGLLLHDLARREAQEDAGTDGEWESLGEL